MSDQFTAFESLPEEYQEIISLAQQKYQIEITPLQLLVGGFSGAVVFLVSVHAKNSHHVEHSILKLDHKGSHAKADEWMRHIRVMENATPQFVQDHLPELVFERVENERAFGIFYRIAGQSLLKYQPLSKFTQQSQLEYIFKETNTVLLSKWNAALTFTQDLRPHRVLQQWLGYRLDPGGKVEQFIQNQNQVNPDTPGFLINGTVFPNPLHFARSSSAWGDVRAIDIATGLLHRDLNTNNILIRFSNDGSAIEGYYLIDFALFKEDMPLFYDHRYLEMSYLLLSLSKVAHEKVIDLAALMADSDIPDPLAVPIEMSGVSGVIAAARHAFARWIKEEYPSLQDDLWGQYWLAGVAAGLSYTHKGGLPDAHRLVGLIFAAANLKRFLTTFKLPLPTDVVFLYDHNQPKGTLQRQSTQTHHNFPVQMTPFIGRKSEIAAIKELILDADIRLVTLIGTGGTGKTRLSLQIAQEVLEHFPNGVFFVPLADDFEENQLISRIAKMLNVREGGRPLLESVKDYLSDKRLLLVLDNFEQLVSFASIVGEILAAAPQVEMLVTSRVTLNLQGEQRFPVPPLTLPEMEGGLEIKNLIDNEAVNLFVKRAQANLPSFKLSKENASAVAEICCRLDGLPLAIELAAARINLLTPQAILNRMENRLGLLTGGGRDVPARQQTLRNTLEWSHNLLNQDEKTLFGRLSVFSGGFSLDAAQEICDRDGHLDILENLAALVDSSLITHNPAADGESRFGMLETLREFATEQLINRDELDVLRDHHAQYYGQIILDQVSRELYSTKARFWLDWVERELDNIRAALAWSLTASGDISLGVRVVFGLIWFWYRRGYLIEGLMWAERMLDAPATASPSPLRALALQSAGLLAIWKGEQDKGLNQLQESLMLYQRAEEDPWIGPSMMSNAVALLNMGRDQAAHPLLVQARKIFKDTGNDYFLTITLVHLGNVELGLGNPDKARMILEQAQSLAIQLDENWIQSFVINNLGEVARVQGQYDLARTYYQKCMNLLENTGDRGDMARFVHSLGYLDQHEGDFEKAEMQFRQGLVMFRRLGNRRGIAECLAGLAGLKARLGDPLWGAAMLAAAERLLQSTGGAWWPADRVEVEQNLAYIQSALDEEQFSQAWKTGKGMSIDQAIEFASDGA